MEIIAGVNYSILVRLPLEIQSIFKSLPFYDFSVVFILSAGVVFFGIFIVNLPIIQVKPINEDQAEDLYPTRDKTVKVKILNTKKNRRPKNKKFLIQTLEKQDPSSIINSVLEDKENVGWKTVESKKSKKTVKNH